MAPSKEGSTAAKVTRREFLKRAGTTATVLGAVVLTGSKSVSAAAKKPRYAMLIDLNKCFGCMACSVACKSEFDVPLGVWRSWVITKEKGKYPDVKRSFVPVLCNQCAEPPCVGVCPTKATVKGDDGIVTQDDEKCIGCKYCVLACPYQVKFAHPKKKVAHKCELCNHRIDQGLQPSCVNTCNAKARFFGDLNDPNSEISKLVRKNKGKLKTLRPELGTEPHVFYLGLEKGDYSLSAQKGRARS